MYMANKNGSNEAEISELMPFPLDDIAEKPQVFSAKATCLLLQLMPYNLE